MDMMAGGRTRLLDGIHMPINCHHQPRGFTIFELLAVITVITVLVTILIPTLKSARESARNAVCASNLRQGILGFWSYAHDHKLYLPYKAYPPVTTNRGAWGWNLSPYLGRDGRHSVTPPLQREGEAFSLQYMRCPSDYDPTEPMIENVNSNTWAWCYFTYGAQYSHSADLAPFTLGGRHRINEVVDSFLIADSVNSGFPSPTSYPWDPVWGGWVASPKEFWRHNGHYNFAYKGGQVKRESLDWFLDNPGKVPSS